MRNFLFHSYLMCLLCSSLYGYANSIIPIQKEASIKSKETLHLSSKFEAIYQFGDSLNDNGNYIRQPYGKKSNYKRFPYGKTIHHATGRASDGLIIADYIASYFNLPMLSPYLANGSNFTNGVNFAVAGACANGGVEANSLATQLSWFKSHLNSIYSNPLAIKEKLQRSLVLMGEIGGNDFNGPFSKHKTIEEVSKLVPGVIATIEHAIEDVIKLGANNIVVPGNFPIGCVPLYLVLFATNDSSRYDELHCLKDYNAFSKFYNQQLVKAIQQLQQKHSSVAIVYADYYSALEYVIRNAPTLGFEQDGDKKACCGAGNNPYNYNPHKFCSPYVQVCQNPGKRVNWDGVHMTQQGNKCVAKWLTQQFVIALEEHNIHAHSLHKSKI